MIGHLINNREDLWWLHTYIIVTLKTESLFLFFVESWLFHSWYWYYTTALAPLAAEGRPGGKKRLANQSITPPLCLQQQTTQLNFIQYESNAAWWNVQSRMADKSFNSETRSIDHATQWQSGKWQASLKPALPRCLSEHLSQTT